MGEKIAKTQMFNLSINPYFFSPSSENKHMDEVLGEFIVFGDGRLKRGKNENLRTYSADIGLSTQANRYHFHYDNGLVDGLEKKADKWYLTSEIRNSDLKAIGIFPVHEPSLISD